MIVSNRFTLDTNILIYAVDRSAGQRHSVANALVHRSAERDCFLTVQALGEFFHAATRKGKATVAQASAYTHAWQNVFRIAASTQSTFNKAAGPTPHGYASRAFRWHRPASSAIERVRDHGLSFWDAMLWVTAEQAGCAFVLSDHGLSFWDAMLWVTAEQAGCAFVLSEDMQHGQSLGGVEILDPFAEDADRALSRLLGR